MTKVQENLIEKVRQALFEDPAIPNGTYYFPHSADYASYISRHDVISALEALFNKED